MSCQILSRNHLHAGTEDLFIGRIRSSILKGFLVVMFQSLLCNEGLIFPMFLQAMSSNVVWPHHSLTEEAWRHSIPVLAALHLADYLLSINFLIIKCSLLITLKENLGFTCKTQMCYPHLEEPGESDLCDSVFPALSNPYTFVAIQSRTFGRKMALLALLRYLFCSPRRPVTSR